MVTASTSRAYLLSTAKLVTSELRLQSKGLKIRLRMPTAVEATNTDGWCVTIGSLGKGQPWLEIWFDKFTKGTDRKLYACFRSKEKSQIEAITKQVSQKLWGIRVVGSDDLFENNYVALAKRLARADFDLPVFEMYENGQSRYGICDPTKAILEKVNKIFAARAVAFLTDVLSILRQAQDRDLPVNIYPQVENRTYVSTHVRRERSQLLATECKIRDGHVCQVCKFYFEDVYGVLGLQFAEAHHIVPLSKLGRNTLTSISDLVTVCSNCHRMLHRMEGKEGDVHLLRQLIKNRQKYH